MNSVDELHKKVNELEKIIVQLSERIKKIEDDMQNDNKHDAQNKGSKWSEDEEIQMINELKKGLKFDEIAKKHERTRGGIRSRVKKIILDKHNKKYDIDAISEELYLDKFYVEKIIEKSAQK